MDNLPKIEVAFAISGRNFDVELFTQELGISPTSFRTEEDWPEAIKENLDLPEELRPGCEWVISAEEETCCKVETPVEQVVSQLKGKEEELLTLTKKYKLKRSLVITVHGDTMALPEMVLSPQVVSFFGRLESQISFDVYAY